MVGASPKFQCHVLKERSFYVCVSRVPCINTGFAPTLAHTQTTMEIGSPMPPNFTQTPLMDAGADIPLMGIREEGLDMPLQARQQHGGGSGARLTEQQQKLAIAQARAPHSGMIPLDVRWLIVLAVVVIVALLLYVFFRNMSKARAIIHKQIIAKHTAITIASQLAPFLPLQKQQGSGLASAALGGPSPDQYMSASGGPPAAEVTPATFPQLDAMLRTIDTFGDMVDNNRADVWVLDTHGWVYADSCNPARAAHPSTGKRPNFNLYNLKVVPPTSASGASSGPSNVGAALVQAAEHGPGLVSFVVPAQGVSGAGISAVTEFVQPVPNTDFIVAVKVGHKTETSEGHHVIPQHKPRSSASTAPPASAAPAPAPPSAAPVQEVRAAAVAQAVGVPTLSNLVLDFDTQRQGQGRPFLA